MSHGHAKAMLEVMLVVKDEAIRKVLQQALTGHYKLTVYASYEEYRGGYHSLEKTPGVIITDMVVERDLNALWNVCKERNPYTPVVVMVTNGKKVNGGRDLKFVRREFAYPIAVDHLRLELTFLIEDAQAIGKLKMENQNLREELEASQLSGKAQHFLERTGLVPRGCTAYDMLKALAAHHSCKITAVAARVDDFWNFLKPAYNSMRLSK